MKRQMMFWMMLAVSSVALAQAPGLMDRLRNRTASPAGLNNRPGAASAAAPAAGATANGGNSGVPMAPNTVKHFGDQEEDNIKTTMPALKFEQSDATFLMEAYADAVGRTLIISPEIPKVTGITLRSQKNVPLTMGEYLDAIASALGMNGITLEPYGDKFLKALPSKTIRTTGIKISMTDPEGGHPEKGEMISQMIQLKNIGVEEGQKAVEGFKGANGMIQTFERTNSILATDTQENVNRMLEIIRFLDQPIPVTEEVNVRELRYAKATEVKTLLDEIVTKSQEESGGGKKTEVTTKNSGSPGTVRNTTVGGGNRLLDRLRGRPGQQQPETPSPNQNLDTFISDADRGMIRGKADIFADERSNKLILITRKDNMKFFDKVIDQLDVETTPDIKVEVIRLKYADAKEVSDNINELIGNASSSKSSSDSATNAKGSSGTTTKTNLSRSTSRTSSTTTKPATAAESKVGELSKDNVTVLADERINGLVIMARTMDMPVLHEMIEQMDVKLSQVLIETVIIEVTLGDGLNTGIDWVRYSKDGSKGMSRQSGDGYALGGGGGGNDKTLFGMVLSNATDFVVNPTGAGINYFLKSDKLNLGAVINASKTDNRAKYIASPIIMTVDNKEATVEATETRKFFNGFETSSNYTYTKTPKYDSKDIGITIKVTPKINPNGTVMLEVEEEYSQINEKSQEMFIDEKNTTMSDTAVTRKMSADVLLENMQTVVLGGLTEKTRSETQSGIPILKDIPVIGKWLFGSVSMSEKRKELLVFMTPYVLNEGEEAQVEALRRKKALSDTRPWDDNGWSLSQLADPVGEAEQMRRLKDEWQKQDKERKTRAAIERAKIERAEKLKQMTQDERDLWLEMHKKELDEEAQEELEKKMLDEKSQEELKALAEKIRKEKLEAAEKELKKNEELTAAENERKRREHEAAARAAGDMR